MEALRWTPDRRSWHPQRMQLGRIAWMVTTIACLLGYALFVCALSVFLPIIVLLQAAFAKAWGRGFSLDNLTLHNFYYLLFEQTQAKQTIVNTFVYSAVTAFAAIALALAIAYVVNRKLVPFSNLLAFLCMAPFVVPGIVLPRGSVTGCPAIESRRIATGWFDEHDVGAVVGQQLAGVLAEESGDLQYPQTGQRSGGVTRHARCPPSRTGRAAAPPAPVR